MTPWGTPYYTGGLLALTVADDGTASGRIVDKASFMDLRNQRVPRVSVRRCVYDEDAAAVTSTELHPYRVAGHYDGLHRPWPASSPLQAPLLAR